jgi:cobalamin-dependent methionine synthase I
LEYIIENAGDLNKYQFDHLLNSINISDRLKTLTQNQKIFMDFECRLWEMLLDSAEKKKERTKRVYIDVLR